MSASANEVALPRDTILHGDCLDVMRTLPDASVDAVITDPPYGLSREPDMVEVLTHWLAGDRYEHGASGGFMGKTWDSFVPGPEYWREVFRVLKPGGHALVFAGTRTWDLMSLALRLAGFENRDTIAHMMGVPALAWLHGQGFPKSHDVSKALDRMVGAERERTRRVKSLGWGTALKPAWECVLCFRKPLAEGNVAANVLRYGTGAINVDACRIPGAKGDGVWGTSNQAINPERKFNASPAMHEYRSEQHPKGRWPANLVLDEAAATLLDAQSGVSHSSGGNIGKKGIQNTYAGGWTPAYAHAGDPGYGDTGGASRFFATFTPDLDAPFLYTPKASRRERNAGCEDLASTHSGYRPNDPDENSIRTRLHGSQEKGGNGHPTVKPLALMQWLCRLITPPGGVILDPFAGSGSTCVAAVREGFHFIGIEREEEYVAITQARIAHAMREQAPQPTLAPVGAPSPAATPVQAVTPRVTPAKRKKRLGIVGPTLWDEVSA